jgi:hypothetical protein
VLVATNKSPVLLDPELKVALSTFFSSIAIDIGMDRDQLITAEDNLFIFKSFLS